MNVLKNLPTNVFWMPVVQTLLVHTIALVLLGLWEMEKNVQVWIKKCLNITGLRKCYRKQIIKNITNKISKLKK